MLKTTVTSHCLRYRRICSKLSYYDSCCKELLFRLQKRGHKKQFVLSIINEVRGKDRVVLLTRKNAGESNVAVPKVYTPRLALTFIPNITYKLKNIVRSHWPKVNDLFQFKLGFSDKNYLTIGDCLSKNKHERDTPYYRQTVDDQNTNFCISRDTTEVEQKCDRRSCKTCLEHIVAPTSTGSTQRGAKIHINGWTLKVPTKYHCETDNIVYLISCTKCENCHYVGETGDTMRNRVYGHRSKNSVVNKEHFSLEDHTLNDMKIIVLSSYNKLKRTVYRRGIEFFYMCILDPTLNKDFAPP